MITSGGIKNRVIAVDGGATASYVYDVEGQRVRKNTASGFRDFVYDLSSRVVAEATASGWEVGYAYMNGALVAQYQNSTTYFIHKDHLGSTRLMTTLGQSIYDSMDYLPFGEQVAGSTGTTHKFAGMESDTESNLNHTWFRQYPATQGRWMTPDPAGMAAVDPTNPQSWNRYTYVLNNPINLIDIAGLDGCYYWEIMCGGSMWGGGWETDASLSGGPTGPGSDPAGMGASVATDSGSYFNSFIAQSNGENITAYLGSIPWYEIAGGHLILEGTIEEFNHPERCPDGCAAEFLPFRFDLGSLSSLISEGKDYIETHPVTISANEIVAGQITYQASSKTLCANLGLGASFPPTKALTVGVVNEGDMNKWKDVLSSWGYSFGANLIVGYQGLFNSSGKVGGPTVSGIGISGSYTYGGCETIP